MSIQFSVRYILRTGLLDRLRESVEPVILLGWRDEELEAELKRAGIEAHPMIERRMGKSYDRVRSWMNLLHKRQLATPSEWVWERRADLHRSLYGRFRRRARRKLFLAATSLPGAAAWIEEKERELWITDTNVDEARAQIDRLRPDAAFSLTPFLPNEEMALRVCEERGIPLCTSILSFDNITTRGWWAVRFDRYMVWNRYNAAELRRSYPEIPESDIEIVGAPQFDFYRNPSFCWSDAEWRRELSLPPDRPVILFAGGYYFCAPHEPRFLQQLGEAIENGQIPQNPVILFRNHPIDPIERWLPVLKRAKNIVYDDPFPKGRIRGHSNMPTRDIQKLASCLFHSAVHINIASTMAVDGAIFDRPQVAPAYDDTPEEKYARTSKELYLQEHYLPITNSGGLEVVHSKDQLIQAVRSALEQPQRLAEGRKRLVREICTYDDGRATERVARSVVSFLEENVMAGDAVAKSA
jgi:CDP-Glycerol:Poly(glycerophosphate) glycerophosphotransferase